MVGEPCPVHTTGQCASGTWTRGSAAQHFEGIVSRVSLERFRGERGFVGYYETSALSGAGCAELRDAIIRNIGWVEIPWTASPRIFKRLKEGILALKDKGKVLLPLVELK